MGAALDVPQHPHCKRNSLGGKPPSKIATLAFTKGELPAIPGISTAASDLCKQVALRYVARHFTSLAATADFCFLPASSINQLPCMDELWTESEEHALLALELWLCASGRSAADVVGALEGLRWASFPSKPSCGYGRGIWLLHQSACDDGVREMIDSAVSLICSSRKRAHASSRRGGQPHVPDHVRMYSRMHVVACVQSRDSSCVTSNRSTHALVYMHGLGLRPSCVCECEPLAP